MNPWLLKFSGSVQMMNKAYIGLGSNISPRLSYLNEAVTALQAVEQISITNQSAIYQTDPVGYEDQNKFLNQVIEIETTLKPVELLEACQSVEEKLGRERTVRWGPRTIDLDLLLYNEEIIELDQLLIPHPRMVQRAFVLVPLTELDSEIHIPTVNKTVKQQLASLSKEEKRGVVKWTKQDGAEG